MRRTLVLALLPLAALLAGCASPSPVGDAEAAHAGSACGPGAFVAGFSAEGAPDCQAPATPAHAGFACPEGHVVTGFDDEGAPRCADLMEVAEASMRAQPAPEPARPSRSLSLSSAGAMSEGVKTYAISSASPMKWGDLSITIDGTHRRLDVAGTCPRTPSSQETFLVCGGERRGEHDPVTAGDQITLSGLASGKTLRILDAQANAVILTLVIG